MFTWVSLGQRERECGKEKEKKIIRSWWMSIATCFVHWPEEIYSWCVLRDDCHVAEEDVV